MNTENRNRTGARWRRSLAPSNISAIYVAILLFAVFSLWIPDLFLTRTTIRTLLDNNAVTALCALALVIPLAAGVVNLAIGAQVGTASIFVGWTLVELGLHPVIAIALSLLLGAAIGWAIGLLIVKARIDSFIGTLGVSSLLAAFITAISGGRQILGMPDAFSDASVMQLFGLTAPVYFVILVSFVLWYILECTPYGRQVYATGGNSDAARLSGISTNKIIVSSLVIGGVVASFAGILVTSRLGNADPTIGPGYLLPAFTAAFFGSTQFKGGRFNIFGTLCAVYVLALGVKGLQLAGAPVWFPDVFNGAALLIAVAFAKYQGSTSGKRSFLGFRGRRGKERLGTKAET